MTETPEEIYKALTRLQARANMFGTMTPEMPEYSMMKLLNHYRSQVQVLQGTLREVVKRLDKNNLPSRQIGMITHLNQVKCLGETALAVTEQDRWGE